MSELDGLLQSLLNMPPRLLLVIGINGLLFMLKRMTSIDPDDLPAVAASVGTIVNPFLMSNEEVPHAIPYPIVLKMLIGFLLGLAAVGAHQALKPIMKKFFGIPTGDTKVFVKAKDVKAVKEATAELKEVTAVMVENTEPVKPEQKEKL